MLLYKSNSIFKLKVKNVFYSVPEGSQIVIVSQDSNELTSLQDMGNHPIVIYNEVDIFHYFMCKNPYSNKVFV